MTIEILIGQLIYWSAPSYQDSTPLSPMSTLPIETIKSFSDKHPKPFDVEFQYGTAGFRTLCVQYSGDLLDPSILPCDIVEELYWTLFYFE